MIKGIIFDFDGLLVDTEIISYRNYKALLSEYGCDFSLQDYSENYSGKPEVINTKKLIDTYHLPIDFESLCKLNIDTETELFAQGVDLKPGAAELLSFLKEQNIKMIIGSSSTRERALGVLKQHGIEELFDGFVFAEDISKSKPDPEVFVTARNAMGCGSNECFVIEDSENGIEAGYRAGIPVICVPDLKLPAEEFRKKAKYVVNSLSDVIGIIKGENASED